MGSPTEVGALVQGSELYNVSLKWSNGKLTAGCDCPFFEEHGNLCKHIWATILEADEQGHLSEVESGSMALEQEALFEQASMQRIKLAKCDDDAMSVADPATVPITIARISQPVRRPAWKEQLSRIAETPAPGRTGAQTWPARTELVYILDVARSSATGALALGIASRGRNKEGGLRNIPKPCPMSRGRIRGSAYSRGPRDFDPADWGQSLSVLWLLRELRSWSRLPFHSRL